MCQHVRHIYEQHRSNQITAIYERNEGGEREGVGERDRRRESTRPKRYNVPERYGHWSNADNAHAYVYNIPRIGSRVVSTFVSQMVALAQGISSLAAFLGKEKRVAADPEPLA